jgi:pyridoxamine 5'-phosphate oxidase
MHTHQTNWLSQLEENLSQHAHLPFAHFVQIATIDGDGRPANRTLTFRFFISEDRLIFTTDTRTEKIRHLTQHPYAEACWYFTESRTQFRLSGKLSVVTSSDDAECMTARQRTWRERTNASRQSFTWPSAGETIANKENFSLPCPQEPPDNFGLLILAPERVECLNLFKHPHERIIHERVNQVWYQRQINP